MTATFPIPTSASLPPPLESDPVPSSTSPSRPTLSSTLSRSTSSHDRPLLPSSSFNTTSRPLSTTHINILATTNQSQYHREQLEQGSVALPLTTSSKSTAVRGGATVENRATAAAGPSSIPAARSLGADSNKDVDLDTDTETDIEMEPIKSHRRRRSSLMNSAAGPVPSPSRPRVPPNRNPNAGPSDKSKISEEDLDLEGFAIPKDYSGDESYTDEDLQDDEETGLTQLDKQRRQRKRQRNTQFDQRIAREKSDLSAEERKEADRNVVKSLLINVGLILLWYAFSLSISIYNKWMFDEDRLNFAFPLFTSSTHMLVQFALSSLVLFFVPSLRPNRGHKSDLGRSRHDDEPVKAPGMTKWFYITCIGPCGAATGLDIGLGNTSLKFISLTFYTMCKSSSLAFVLLFAFLFRLETPTWRLVAIIATMTLGVVLMVFGEVQFSMGGFALVISAAFFSGFRWALTQILLLRNPATSNPFSSIFFLTPVMFAVLAIIAIPVEGVGNLIAGIQILRDQYGAVLAPLFLLFPGCLAFCMTASEFALLQRTSVVTLSIAGIFKEVVTISAATIVFHDRLTLINFIGLLTTLLAIMTYNYIKITKMRHDAQSNVHEQHATEDEGFDGQSSGILDSDRDDGADEAAGLLHDSLDLNRPDPLVTTDGDFQPLLQPVAPSRRDRSV